MPKFDFDRFLPNLSPPAVSPPGTPWSRLSGDAKGGFCVRLFVPKLNHHTMVDLGPFQSGFSRWEDAKPFEVKLTIIAENMVERLSRRFRSL